MTSYHLDPTKVPLSLWISVRGERSVPSDSNSAIISSRHCCTSDQMKNRVMQRSRGDRPREADGDGEPEGEPLGEGDGDAEGEGDGDGVK